MNKNLTDVLGFRGDFLEVFTPTAYVVQVPDGIPHQGQDFLLYITATGQQNLSFHPSILNAPATFILQNGYLYVVNMKFKNGHWNLININGGFKNFVATLDWNPALGSFASTVGPTPAFSRASTATYVDATGLIKTAAINVPRITYDPITHKCLGYLAEEQRTNIIKRSSAFDLADWDHGDGSVTPNVMVSPDGTANADKATFNTSGLKQSFSTAAAGNHVFSVFVKAGTASWIFAEFFDGTDRLVWFDIANGVVGSTLGGATGTIQAFPNGWYRCTVLYNLTITSNFAVFAAVTGNNSVTRAGDIYAWGAQVEAGAFPTSYMATGAAAATRSADVCQIGGTDFTGFYSQSEGTFITKIIANQNGVGVIIQATDGGLNNQAMLARRSTPASAVEVFAFGIKNGKLDGMIPNYVQTSVSAALANNNYGLSIDGVMQTVDISLPSPLPLVNQLFIGAASNGSPLNGTIARIQYFPDRLPDYKLIELTKP